MSLAAVSAPEATPDLAAAIMEKLSLEASGPVERAASPLAASPARGASNGASSEEEAPPAPAKTAAPVAEVPALMRGPQRPNELSFTVVGTMIHIIHKDSQQPIVTAPMTVETIFCKTFDEVLAHAGADAIFAPSYEGTVIYQTRLNGREIFATRSSADALQQRWGAVAEDGSEPPTFGEIIEGFVAAQDTESRPFVHTLWGTPLPEGVAWRVWQLQETSMARGAPGVVPGIYLLSERHTDGRVVPAEGWTADIAAAQFNISRPIIAYLADGAIKRYVNQACGVREMVWGRSRSIWELFVNWVDIVRWAHGHSTDKFPAHLRFVFEDPEPKRRDIQKPTEDVKILLKQFALTHTKASGQKTPEDAALFILGKFGVATPDMLEALRRARDEFLWRQTYWRQWVANEVLKIVNPRFRGIENGASIEDVSAVFAQVNWGADRPRLYKAKKAPGGTGRVVEVPERRATTVREFMRTALKNPETKYLNLIWSIAAREFAFTVSQVVRDDHYSRLAPRPTPPPSPGPAAAPAAAPPSPGPAAAPAAAAPAAAPPQQRRRAPPADAPPQQRRRAPPA